MSRIATISELGWLPVTDELDISRISYYQHLMYLDNSRIVKKAFNIMRELYANKIDSDFPYFKNINQIFVSRGADHLLNEDICILKFKECVRQNHMDTFMEDIKDLPSLQLYSMLRSNPNILCAPYLFSKAPFKAIQQKFKLRTGILGLGADLHRQHRDPGLCNFCNMFETPKHLVMYCQAYGVERHNMFENIKKKIDPESFNVLLQYPDLTFFLLLGDHDDIFNSEFLSFLSKAMVKRNDF
jgi:hypothetical protein